MNILRRMLFTVAPALLAVACGGGGDDGDIAFLGVVSGGDGRPPIISGDDALVDDNLPPSPVIEATPRQGNRPLAVTFNAGASSDFDGTISRFHWDFGDGSEDFGVTVTHTYTEFGNFTARLTVTDNDGASVSASVLISVVSPDDNFPPSAVFEATPRSGAAPLTVSFNAGASSDADGAVVEHRWSFGDGETAAGVVVAHSYSESGVYTASLTVVDNDGAIGSASLPIIVIGADEQTAGEAPARTARRPEIERTGAVGADGRQLLVLEPDSAVDLVLKVEDFAADDPFRNDLDIYLFDLADPQRPRYLASSVGSGALESVRIPAPGRYGLLVESSAGSSAYSLSAGSGPLSARLEDDFVPGELLLVMANPDAQPAWPQLTVLAESGDRTLRAGLSGAAIAAGDRFWRQDAALAERYATVRMLKRLRTDPAVAFVALDHRNPPAVPATE